MGEQTAGYFSSDDREDIVLSFQTVAASEEYAIEAVKVAKAHGQIETQIEDLLGLTRLGKQVSEMGTVSLATLSETCWQTVASVDATMQHSQWTPTDSGRLIRVVSATTGESLSKRGQIWARV